jgi:HAMP domain-containing protein
MAFVVAEFVFYGSINNIWEYLAWQFQIFSYICHQMLRLPKIISRTLSVRISLMVVIAMTILLMASLVVMLHFSRQAVKEEAIEKATQTLDGTVKRIDNVLLSVEQATGNIFFRLMEDLDKPDMMYTYCRKLVETNPYVAGCAVAFKENYYEGRQYFMAYVHRTANDSLAYTDSPIIQSDTFGNCPYTQQVWFTEPMKTGYPEWLNPLLGMDSDEKPIFTFCLPLFQGSISDTPGEERNPIGVIGVDVSLSLLSKIVSEAKLSEHSYCTLLNRDGSYIVHPNGDKLMHQTALTVGKEDDESARKAAQAMVSGETGYKPFRLDGIDYYVFFKPFKRAAVPGRWMEDLGWSAGIVYPEDDIFGDYNSLFYYVLAIAIVGMLLLFFLSRSVIHRQLQPLNMLTEKAQLIAEGHYDEPIPASKNKDEIGRLQDIFSQMQQTLATHIGELEQLTATLRERGEGLRNAYKQAQKAERMKISFLHNMTNQMIASANAINDDVEALCNVSHSIGKQEAGQLADDIQQKGNAIAEVLKNLINISDEEKLMADQADPVMMRKEADDV